MTKLDMIRLVYQTARDFNSHASTKVYEYNNETSKTAMNMLNTYVEVIRQWDVPEQLTDDMIRATIKTTVTGFMQVAHFKKN